MVDGRRRPPDAAPTPRSSSRAATSRSPITSASTSRRSWPAWSASTAPSTSSTSNSTTSATGANARTVSTSRSPRAVAGPSSAARPAPTASTPRWSRRSANSRTGCGAARTAARSTTATRRRCRWPRPPRSTPLPETPCPTTRRSQTASALDDHEPGRIVRTKEHPATPMTVDDALYEMELVGHDFFLFHDKESDKPTRGVPAPRLRLRPDPARLDRAGPTTCRRTQLASSASHLRWTSSDAILRSHRDPLGEEIACCRSCSVSVKAAWSSASRGWLTMSTPCPTTSRSCPTPSCAPRPTSSRSASADGETLDDLLPEAFAVAREAAWRVLDQRPFDVQVMGGAALHFGNVAEMKTGEGKTLTCVLPAYLNALARQRRARRHRQRLPGQTRQRVDGPRAPLPRPRRRRDPGPDDARRAPRRVRRRHHLRHQQRVRLRLPARQHGALARGHGAARPQLRRSSTRSTRSSSTRPAPR